MEDLSAVPQENIIDFLLDRLQRGQIYTWVGTFLLAINPSGEITAEDIYDLSRTDEYDNICSLTHKEVAPHIFAVAARAHYRIIQGLGKPSQVIVLNGETGAGKTFNAWKALEFLTASTRHIFADTQKQDLVCGIVQRIADACRLISAFSTAPTERNEVSSRNVQLVWLEYKMGNICGAKISSYLLERDRVTKGCCNFQIFSQMMTALGNEGFADTGLSKDIRYFMLSDLDPLEGQHFRDGFQDTLKAMDMLGFTEVQRKNIFLILSLLIHMSNIRFIQENDHCRIDTDNQESKEAFENTCRLACVKKEEFAELLTSILINPRGFRRRHSVCRRNLDTNDACRYRLHSIIRHLYDLLFHWLINHVNGILSASVFSERLGILDIFGFECFNANGIEQLCVNYVNERLQQYFVEKYLESCRKDLQTEGLIDNEESSEIVQLYEDRLSTIDKYLFATLNDVCLSTVPCDSSMLIRQVNATSCPAARRFLSVKNDNFVIQHYAGAVEYSANDLLSKNNDKIPDEITMTFSVSKNTFLYSLIDKNKPHHNGKVKKPTMLSKLRYNVGLLIEELNKCDMHYVRCIKPRRLDNHNWDRDELWRQLTNTGILDALPLARCKYPIQFIYKEFYKRYCTKCIETSDLRTACEKILELYRPTMDDDLAAYCGKKIIFLSEFLFMQLERARLQRRVESVKKIESFWIKYRNRQRRNTEGNKADESQVIVNTNIQNGSIEESQSEYEYVMHSRDSSEATQTVSLQCKTARIINWLEDVNNTPGVVKSDELSVISVSNELEELLVNHDHSQFADIKYNNNVYSQYSNNSTLHVQNEREKNSVDYNKEEDMYVIQRGASTMFYKNGILSRQPPTKLPVKVHTRLICLANSRYLVQTKLLGLPQGLQDCL
ncbi:myosin ID heavy chain-like isoform X2 [Linepithema humile]|nr:PREDICTED: myosin ID heavy chain-like isoform X2 [Linepithema humile]